MTVGAVAVEWGASGDRRPAGAGLDGRGPEGSIHPVERKIQTAKQPFCLEKRSAEEAVAGAGRTRLTRPHPTRPPARQPRPAPATPAAPSDPGQPRRPSLPGTGDRRPATGPASRVGLRCPGPRVAPDPEPCATGERVGAGAVRSWRARRERAVRAPVARRTGRARRGACGQRVGRVGSACVLTCEETQPGGATRQPVAAGGGRVPGRGRESWPGSAGDDKHAPHASRQPRPTRGLARWPRWRR
ncbi:hypothetical protein HNR67_003580 [Crossiella cryophila]|uniref:Uncharacterized protein n=1 Tax=Crossiella cryophila TaxID=43355 RepID=A0A7W7CAL0_9PSEU|nr:hypothetical protein [Crossiella cryophila]